MPQSFTLLERIAARADSSPESVAIIDTTSSPSTSYTYAQLLSDVLAYSAQIEKAHGSNDLQDARVAILADKGYPIVVALLATFAAGGLALPLLPSLPAPEHAYMMANAEVSLLICDASNGSRADELLIEHAAKRLPLSKSFGGDDAAPAYPKSASLAGDRKAMMLFTSGTTGRPKGVVTRHSALSVQVSDIVDRWRWSADDLLLHVLPLNHLHGIVVALFTTLWAGAAVELWSKLDGEKVWRRWMTKEECPITMMFGVPTVYSRLLAAHAKLSPDEQQAASEASSRMRLQVSGSAPLPAHVKEQWDGRVGGKQLLLERYGMTETGILLSTGYEDEKRIVGFVGHPLPHVQVRLWDSDANELVEEYGREGEIQVKGPGIFNEYYNLPEATAKEFDGDWFKTGDVGVRIKEQDGMYRVLGRKSVDIIKSGGEKLSALDIERALLELDYITDAAVVGIPNDEWGQIVGAIVVTTRPDLTLDVVRTDLRSKIAAYKLPRALKVFEEIPRNAMGKIQKKALVKEFA